MRRMKLAAMLLVLVCCGSGCVSGTAEWTQCVPYARQLSGIEIYGDAYTWWDRATPRYARGNTPGIGAVLVLSRTERLRYGHLAVVKRILGARRIEVAHANWGKDIFGRGYIHEAMLVEDASPANDWSELRFWIQESGSFSSVFPARGFIYPLAS